MYQSFAAPVYTVPQCMELRNRTWWRHQMETFSALLALCAGISPVTGEFQSQRPVTRSFDAFFLLRLNKRLSKLPWGWWFETSSRSSWRHCNKSGKINWKRPYLASHFLLLMTLLLVLLSSIMFSRPNWFNCCNLCDISWEFCCCENLRNII